MEKEKVALFNPWWQGKGVDPALALSFKRSVYSEVQQILEKRFVIALTGLRRMGKTTVMYQTIDHLLKKGVKPENILFFSFDEYPADIDDLLSTYTGLTRIQLREERAFVFLDEVQKCEGWENQVKKYYDLYPKIKFFLSGSESLFIRKKTKETLAGRLFEYGLRPLSFKEYLSLKNVPEKELHFAASLVPHFMEFAESGGFPETVAMENGEELRRYVRSIVVDKIVYKDIPKIFRIDDPDFLVTLLELISSNPGIYLDYQSLGRQFGKDRRVVKAYVHYLEESFLVRLLGNYRKGKAASLRKLKRAYPSDTAFIRLFKPQTDDAFFGRVVETLVLNAADAQQFWRNAHEIDAVVENRPLEVKYQEHISSSDLKGLREFMRKFGRKSALLVTKKDEQKLDVPEGEIQLLPAWKFLLERTPES